MYFLLSSASLPSLAALGVDLGAETRSGWCPQAWSGRGGAQYSKSFFRNRGIHLLLFNVNSIPDRLFVSVTYSGADHSCDDRPARHLQHPVQAV